MNDDRPDLRFAYLLTGATMATASAGGVFATDWLYRDNALITATFRGQDMVTLLVAVPLLLVGLVWEMRGSPRGRVLWLGMVAAGLGLLWVGISLSHLAAASVEVARQNVGAGSELPIWAGLTMLGVVTVALLFAGIRRPSGSETATGDLVARAGARSMPGGERSVV